MTSQPDTANLPCWDLADRMRKSLRTADMSVAEMADYLDVAPRTVSNWINGHIEPSTQTAKQWALRTGVPYTWFCHGSNAPCDLGPPRKTAGHSGIGRRANNMQSPLTNIA